jgi:trigger factor
MKHKINKLPKSEVEIEAEISAGDFENYIKKAKQELTKEIKVDGFRPGKAPPEIAEQKLAEDKILDQATRIAIEAEYPKIIKEEKLEVIGRPEVSILKVAKDNPLVFKIKVALVPEVKLPDYQKVAEDIQKNRPKEFNISKEEINSAINWLLRSRAKYVKANHPVEKGNFVEIDFESESDDKPIKDGSSKNHPLILGEGRFMPGFEEKILGMKEDEKKEFSLKAPGDYYRSELANKDIKFKVKVRSVQDIELPEFNDEFLKSLGNFDSKEALEKSINEGLVEGKKTKEKENFRSTLIEAIAKDTNMELPEVLVQGELEKMLEEIILDAKRLNLKIEDYLKQIKKTPDELIVELRPEAEKRAQIGLTLEALAKKENIKLDEKEVEDRLNEYLKKFASIKEAKEKVDLDKLRVYTEGVLRNEKVFERLEEVARL